MHVTRLKLEWYKRRAATKKRIKQFFVGKIIEHCPDIGMPEEDLYMLNYEDLCELAIACANQAITIILGTGQDYDDTSDAKVVVSQDRHNNAKTGSWHLSWRIKGCQHKLGPLRVVAYNHIEDEFYFFYIPHNTFRNRDVVEITIQRENGTYFPPKFTGNPEASKHLKYWSCREPTFEEMAQRDPVRDTAVWDNLYTLVEDLTEEDLTEEDFDKLLAEAEALIVDLGPVCE